MNAKRCFFNGTWGALGRRAVLLALTGLAVLIAPGCDAGALSPNFAGDNMDSAGSGMNPIQNVFPPQHLGPVDPPQPIGVGGGDEACPLSPRCDAGITVPVDPSLEVSIANHPAVLSRFKLSAVLGQLLAQAGSNQSPTELLRRLWDPYNSFAKAQFTEAFAPHCTFKNTFPLDCPRGDGADAIPGAVTPDGSFTPIALFNRFDLAPINGAHCGEYRIVYWTANAPNFGTVIFEAQIPNPTPSCGIASCRPIVDFWRSLAGLPENTLADRLQDFYFNGLPGFRPAIEIHSYGLGVSRGAYGTSGGQVRVNTITDGKWQLRENHLALDTTGGVNTLFFKQVTDKSNPFGDLFQGGNTAFNTAFTSGAVASLSAGSLNTISMSTADSWNASQSTSQFGTAPDNYALETPSLSFAAQIAAAIPGGNLTVNQILARATTQSCAGCHQVSSRAALGGGLTWPASGTPSFGRFVHVGPQGDFSEALECVFLPHRQSVLAGFAQACGSNPPETVPQGCPILGGRGIAPLPGPLSETLGGGGLVN